MEKLGNTLGVKGTKSTNPKTGRVEDKTAAAAGRKAVNNLKKNSPTLPTLIENVQEVWEKRGFVRGLDGRLLRPRKKSAVFNTVNQSAGAVVMKWSQVELDRRLQAAGLVPGTDYEFVATVHDEWQIEARPEVVELVATTGKQAIIDAGLFYKLRCPLDGAFEIGPTWAATH